MLEFRAEHGAGELPMGATLPLSSSERVTLKASVRGAQGQRLVWIRNGEPLLPLEELGEDRTEVQRAVTATPGDWFSLRIEDAAGGAIVLSNAVYFPRAEH